MFQRCVETTINSIILDHCHSPNSDLHKMNLDLLKVVGNKHTYSPNDGLMVISHSRIRKKSPNKQI